MGTIVAGVDFGTLSVRVSIFDSKRGRLGSGTAEYPLHRSKSDPDQATQSHDDHMKALAAATQIALGKAHVSGGEVAAIALDTTGSSVIPVGAGMVPLDEYYLWCDHRSWREAAEITAKAHAIRPPRHRLVRWRLLQRVGLFKAAPLAPSQSQEARPTGFRL